MGFRTATLSVPTATRRSCANSKRAVCSARVQLLEPREATYDELLAFHTPRYVDFVRERSHSGQGFLDGGDTPAFRGVYEAAATVVGASITAAEAIMSGAARAAFVPIAGLHHAGRDHAAGFCVFNDCGVVIELLRRRHGLQRIGYVDIDAHHGDGVYFGFEDDPAVIFADIHEDGESLYPGTGKAEDTGRATAAGTKLNLPLMAGSGDRAFQGAWARVLEHMERFEPQFLLLQCGADSIDGDPITHLRFSPAMHGRAAHDLVQLAGTPGPRPGAGAGRRRLQPQQSGQGLVGSAWRPGARPARWPRVPRAGTMTGSLRSSRPYSKVP